MSLKLKEQILAELWGLPEDGMAEVLALVKRLLEERRRPSERPTRPLRDLLGVIDLGRAPPTDKECRRILEQERLNQ